MAPKPKFKLDLTINELSNIPQVSGHCYIDLHIRDSKRVKSLPFKGLSLLNGSSSGTSDNEDSEPSRNGSNPNSSSGLVHQNNDHSIVTSTSSGTGGNISVTTSKRKIQNFECPINIHISCNLKFGLKRRENLIADKYLLMKIYYVGEKHKEFGVHNPNSNKLELGKLEINLAEYLNFNEPVTSKYLLKDSKINSILSTTIHLTELSANRDFHTELELSETRKHHHTQHPHQHHLNQTKTSNATKSDGHYNVPHFERKNVFGGLNDVIGSENRNDSPAGGARSSEDSRRDHSPITNDDNKNRNPTKKLFHTLSHQNSQGLPSVQQQSQAQSQLLSQSQQQQQQHLVQSRPTSSNNDYNTTNNGVDSSRSENNQFRNDQTILIDPIINDLYKKILESTWDPKLHSLLAITPEDCVESIFDGSSDRLRDQLKQELMKDEEEEDNELRGILGLINESVYRDDLKSWTINSEVK